LGRSIVLAFFVWTSALAAPPMEIAVDDGCGFD
jgi:hypothetical protein